MSGTIKALRLEPQGRHPEAIVEGFIIAEIRIEQRLNDICSVVSVETNVVLDKLVERNRNQTMDVQELDMIYITSFQDELRRLIAQADSYMVKEVEMLLEIRRKVSVRKLVEINEDKRKSPGRPKKVQVYINN